MQLHVKILGRYLAHIGRLYHQLRCGAIAASLSYTSLLALVPVMAIVFAVLAAVPPLEGFRAELQQFMFANLMPESSDKFAEYFDAFVANAGKMTGFGVIGLAITSIMLINTVFTAVNIIFGVDRPRPVLLRIGIYLGVLIAGPIVLAASFSLATYILALTRGLEVEAFTGLLGRLARFIPALILIAGFSIFYKVVPSRRVIWSDAVRGGLLAGLGFSGLRWLFGVYLIYFPSYQSIYGALSAVPVFLLWMFLSWSVVLSGAVLAASGPDWRRRRD